jgi:hypothetical protein
MAEPRQSYSVGQRLRHYSGPVWVVEEAGLDDGAFQGYYRIRPEAPTGQSRPASMRVHYDYLHNRDGWSVLDG